MRIAILGATSQIAKDLILSFAADKQHELVLFARRPEAVKLWLDGANLTQAYSVADYGAFTTKQHFDAIINFVGVGDPAKAVAMGASIFDVTIQYDELALNYLKHHPQCRYIFLSSGAAYGSNFAEPANASTKAIFDINHIKPQDWYGAAKLHAECRHRSLPNLSIIDLRVFNYFSHTQDIEARFFICEAVRAIRDKSVLTTSSENMARDYLHPEDFYQMVLISLAVSEDKNIALDCYSKAPIEKNRMLEILKKQFDLKYIKSNTASSKNATGYKLNYYSINHEARNFDYKPKWTSIEGLLNQISLISKINYHRKI